MKTIHIHYLKIIGHIQENKQKSKCIVIICNHEIMRLIIMKIEMKIKKHDIGLTQIDLGLDMDTDIIDIKSVLL